jgi:hypothetical protein
MLSDEQLRQIERDERAKSWPSADTLRLAEELRRVRLALAEAIDTGEHPYYDFDHLKQFAHSDDEMLAHTAIRCRVLLDALGIEAASDDDWREVNPASVRKAD